MAAVFVQFEKKASAEEILIAWREFVGKPQKLGLPSAPKPFLTYFDERARPQTRLDRDVGNGMGMSRRTIATRHDLRLALRRAVAQHRARRRGRRDFDGGALGVRRLHRGEINARSAFQSHPIRVMLVPS